MSSAAKCELLQAMKGGLGQSVLYENRIQNTLLAKQRQKETIYEQAKKKLKLIFHYTRDNA